MEMKFATHVRKIPTYYLWAITATIDGVQIPTFYLNRNVQGILTDVHAKKIAHDIITFHNRVKYEQVDIVAVMV